MAYVQSSIIDMFLSRAEKNGEFANLPGMERSLANLNEPKEAVMDRLRAEATTKPPVVVLKQQVILAQARLRGLTDPEERRGEMQLLGDLQMRLSKELESLRHCA